MTRRLNDIHWARVGSVGWLLAVLIAVAISTSPVSAAVNPYRLRDYDHSGTACASISTTSGDPGFYKTRPNSVTGTTFNGTDLLFSCWADNTITAIRPVASQTIFAKDTTVGNNGLYTVTGVTGLGGLAWDPTHNVLWACNLSAFTGTNKKLGSDLGYISLNSNGTATFTHFATAPDGCVNGVDYNPSTSVVSASGREGQRFHQDGRPVRRQLGSDRRRADQVLARNAHARRLRLRGAVNDERHVSGRQPRFSQDSPLHDRFRQLPRWSRRRRPVGTKISLATRSPSPRRP